MGDPVAEGVTGPPATTRTARWTAAVLSTQRTSLLLALTLGMILAVQAPVLSHYFFNDDFVPLADISTRSTPAYVRDLFLMNDLTPNWRFLTGMIYLVEYRLFELNAAPYFALSMALHVATAGLIFAFMRRATDSDWASVLAASWFGVSAASVPTVGQVTAFNNVLAGFFVMAAIMLLFEALAREQLNPNFLAGSIVAFAAAIAANESASVTAPVLMLVAAWKAPLGADWWLEPRELARVTAIAAPFVLLGAAALIGFSACGCTEAELYGRENIVDNVWLYFGRLLYPIGLEFPGHVEKPHLVAGILLGGIALAALIRGIALARISAVFLMLAIVPYLPIALWAAQRYTYLASIPFAMLMAAVFWHAGRYFVRINVPAAAGVIGLVAAGVIAWNAWQTVAQNGDQADAAEPWRQLVSAVEAAYPSIPPGSSVYIRGGPVTNELAQCAVMPSIADVLWKDSILFTVPREQMTDYRARSAGYQVFVGDYIDGRIVPQPVRLASQSELRDDSIWLLPHIPPETTGNVCRPGIVAP